MVGDWVILFDDILTRVDAIGDVKIYLTDDQGYEWHSEYPHIKPVVITRQFLEKNGFVLAESTDIGEEYVFSTDHRRCPQTIVAFSIYKEPVAGAKSLVRCWTKPDGVDGQNDAHICNVRYVHELQHILKTVGIKKEVVL